MDRPLTHGYAASPSSNAGRIAAIGWLAISMSACAALAPPPEAPPAPVSPVPCEDSIFRRASEQQSSYFESEAKRLEADLRQAETAMITIESGMRSHQSRADAVSMLAESRISVERAARNVPWRATEVADALSKLDEAERQLLADHLGTAVFFASRAHRIADKLNAEAELVAANQGTRFIRAQRVNLRSGPSTEHKIMGVLTHQTPVLTERHQDSWWLVRTLSGQVGWVHATLLQ